MFIVRKCAAVLGVLGRDSQGNVVEGFIIKEKKVKNSMEVEALREQWGEISVSFEPSATKYYSEHRA